MGRFTIDWIDEANIAPEIWQHLLVFKLAALKLIGSDADIANHIDKAIKDKIESPRTCSSP